MTIRLIPFSLALLAGLAMTACTAPRTPPGSADGAPALPPPVSTVVDLMTPSGQPGGGNAGAPSA
ncbi:MAG: hypothetical protein EOO54_27615, partial [Haliea sp.]